jgi:hypothetical protein
MRGVLGSPIGSRRYHGPSFSRAISLREAQTIGESIVGRVDWHGAEGYCSCPGEGLHTTRTTSTDCKIICAPLERSGGTLKPGVYCFHGSCRGAVEAASYLLRSALGRRCPGQPCQILPQRPTPKRKSEFDHVKLKKIAARLEGVDAGWLAERSPICPWNRMPASFLHALYKPGENILIFDVFNSQGQGVWTHDGFPYDARELDCFRAGKPCGVWFLINPVDGAFGPNENGRQSRRSAANITSWRYLLIESDNAEFTDWLAALVQMPLPISAIYTSGGRSTHALIRVDAESKAHWDMITAGLKPALMVLGADSGAMTAVRLSRLPCCERLGTTDRHGVYNPFSDGPRLQRLLYLNPAPDSTPVCERRAI